MAEANEINPIVKLLQPKKVNATQVEIQEPWPPPTSRR
jgi:hypothetical protein